MPELSRDICARIAPGGDKWYSKAAWYNQPIGCSAHGGGTHRPYSERRKEDETQIVSVVSDSEVFVIFYTVDGEDSATKIFISYFRG
jgi:hypothetical protein